MYIYTSIYFCGKGEHNARLKMVMRNSGRIKLSFRQRDKRASIDAQSAKDKPHGTAVGSRRVPPELDKIPCGFYHTNSPVSTCLTCHQIDSIDTANWTRFTQRGQTAKLYTSIQKVTG